jgi:hypothetical protein
MQGRLSFGAISEPRYININAHHFGESVDVGITRQCYAPERLEDRNMELPVVIEPLPDRKHFSARLGSPFNLSAEAATPEEAHQKLAELLQLRMQQGLTLRAINVPAAVQAGAEPGWLVDDELTREWLQQVQQFRAESDAGDRRRLGIEPAGDEGTP